MAWWDTAKEVGTTAGKAYVGWPALAYDAYKGNTSGVMGGLSGQWSGGNQQMAQLGNMTGQNYEGGGYLSGMKKGGSIDTDQFGNPFFPAGEPPTYNPSGTGTPNREALDFLKDYGTQPLDQQSPWAKMQQSLGERQLANNLGGIDRQTMSQSNQMMGDVAARGGLDAASAARIGQTASRAGMQASQGARGDHQDFMTGVGSTDLQQRLGASGKVAGLEPSYASQAGADERYKYAADFDRWGAMQKAYGDAELAKAIGKGGSSPMFSQNMLGNAFGGGGGGGGGFWQGMGMPSQNPWTYAPNLPMG